MVDEVVTAVERLKRNLGANLPLDRVVLFGSRARGDARADSDVDLIVVSPAFEGRSLGERAEPLYRAWDSTLPVDFLCYTPAEFAREKERVSIVRLAMEEGHEVTA